jgi:hypothetical protein
MHRWLAVAALGAAFLTSSAWAQRRGGGGFAAHGGFTGHAGLASHGPVGGGHAPVVTRGFAGAPRGTYWGGRPGGWSHSYGWGYPRYWVRWLGYPYFRYGFYPRRGYYGGWYGYPWWGVGWGNDYSYPPEPNTYYVYQPDTYAQERALEQQAEIDRLNDEVARLREEHQAQAAPRPAATSVREQTELVYRDKHTEQIENYAIVGQTLWVFNEQRSRKVALADLDIAATKKANEARGVEFNLPR